jgi:hypothetical protein
MENSFATANRKGGSMGFIKGNIQAKTLSGENK